MSITGQVLDDIIEGGTHSEKLENIRNRFSEDELQELAESGSELAEDALKVQKKDKMGNEKAKEIVEDDKVWEENPAEAITALEKTVEDYDPEFDWRDKGGPSAKDRSERFRSLLRNGHYNKAKEFIEIVDPQSDIDDFDEDDVQEMYEEKLKEDNPEEALAIAKIFGEQFDVDFDYSDPRDELISKHNKNGDYVKEALARKKWGKMVYNPAIDLYDNLMENGEYETAADVIREYREQYPDRFEGWEYGEREMKSAAKKAFRNYREDGNYDRAVEVAQEYDLDNDSDIKDTLLLAAAKGDINRWFLEEVAEDRGYDIDTPDKEPLKINSEDEGSDDEPDYEENHHESSESGDASLLGKAYQLMT